MRMGDVRRIGAGFRARWRSWSRWSRTARVAGVVMVLVLVSAASPVVLLRLADVGTPRADVRTRGHDAYWIGHRWVDGRATEAEVTALAAQLAGTGVADVFVHTGPLADDGSLPADLAPRAGWFVAAVHRAAPGLRVQAWLGDLVAPTHDALDMANPQTRNHVAGAVTQVLDLGFDGVHFDLEPVHSGSPDYLAILDRAHALTGARGVRLSVSAPQLDPLPGLHLVGAALGPHGKFWSQRYFAQVASRVDQIAVMSYDTWMPTPELYSGYVARQTALALAVTPPGVDLLMGVPAYWAEDYGHHGSAETVPAALRGIRLGLGRTAPDRQNVGVALYVDYTATPDDWAAYRRDWGSDGGVTRR
ncbi:glycoside hydrolase family 18 protein [Nocardia stercoris]|uniref:GH18 domain-containing protein n=1 Tax=Nocardia stercoris TaxID=2483361 RepID=A0A3M2LGB5_9NOCA|nr:glycoside hydrolase family 18 protein [Nocardia stercoris]RMI35633.1 hypothetical protein EBN03_05220 [Nocardia stercoris]